MNSRAAGAQSLQPQPETSGLKRELRLADLVLFNVIATLGPQLIPAFAHVGPVAIPLHVASAVLFFVPCVLVIAGLSRRFPGEGGFYVWTRQAFGEMHAFLCGWCWWVSVLLFLPTVVLVAVGMLTQVNPASTGVLPENSASQVGLSLLVLWATVIVNMVGLRFTKWLTNSACTLLYTGLALVVAASLLVFAHSGSATSFRFGGVFTLDGISLWSQIAFAYTGLELGSLLGGEICNPSRTIPRAAWLSAAAVTLGYVASSVALMLVIKPAAINPIGGLVQVASIAGRELGFNSLGTVAAVLFFAGFIGKLSTWGGGAARLPFVIGIDGAMPEVFTRVHPKWGTPWIALLIQGAACSVFLLFTQAGETARSGWQTLMDMEILASLIPFAYIFLCGWRFGQRAAATAGLLVTSVALVFSAIPPETTVSVALFELKLIGGSALLLFSGWFAFAARGRRARV